MSSTISLADCSLLTTAETLRAACEAARDGDHDLIISDIGLPDGCGLDLMRQVVARRGKFPAIALTGYGNIDDGRFSTPSLTTIDLDIPEIARRTVELISRRIAGHDDGPARTVIPTTLIRAESTLGATRTESWTHR